MPSVELTKANFEEVVTGDNVVIVDFWAPWCGPCRAFAPVFESVSDQHADVVFGKVNTEEERELAAAFQIRSIPTLMALRENVILYSEPGAMPEHALQELVEKLKTVDMSEVRREIAAREADEADT